MKKILSAVLALPLVLLSCCTREADWLSFSTYEGGFTIEAPDVLEEQIAAMNTLMGSLQFNAYVVEKDMVVYMVGYCDYPDTVIKAGSPDRLLDFAIEGAISSLKGKVIHKVPINLGEYYGRELVIDQVTTNQEHTIRIYLVGNRMYQLSVVIPKRDEYKQNRERFLGAFKLLR
jgi:hypothetical protein